MIAYRQATQADAPAVLSLLEEIMTHHGAASPGRERLSSVVSGIIAASDHCFLVAEASGAGDASGRSGAAAPAGRIVGMCALVFSVSTWSAAPVCELQDVIVTQDYRREEVGQRLLAVAEEIARARGCSRLFLLAESLNLGAHSFYRNLGLQEKTCLYFERDFTETAAD